MSIGGYGYGKTRLYLSYKKPYILGLSSYLLFLVYGSILQISI